MRCLSEAVQDHLDLMHVLDGRKAYSITKSKGKVYFMEQGKDVRLLESEEMISKIS